MKVRDVYFNEFRSGDKFNIYLLPDAHFGSPAFLECEYERLARIIENDKDAYVVIQGDLCDLNRPSTRKIKKVAFHDRMEEYEQEDDRALLWIDQKVIPKLTRLVPKNRWLGALDGDHYMTMANGLSSTQYICSKTGIPYLGDGTAIIRLHFRYCGRDSFNKGLSIHVQHGIGGSGRPGSAVNKLEDTASIFEGIDVFMRGHSHRAFIYPHSRYYLPQNGQELRQRDTWLINAPSFRTGFVVGRTDYAEQRMYGATAHKFPVLHVTLRRIRIDKKPKITMDLAGELL